MSEPPGKALTADLGRALRDSDEPEHAASLSSTLQQIRPLSSADLAELDEDITGFLRCAHDDEDITP